MQKQKTIVDEAILDAIAIREAAEQTAEKRILQKYSIDIKKEVQKLLEQEVPMVDQPTEMDPMAAGSVGTGMAGGLTSSPMGLGTEADLPIDPEKAGSDSENESILSQLEYAFKDGEVIDGKRFPEGVVEINLDALNESMFNDDPLYELDEFDLDEDKLFEPKDENDKGNDPMILDEDEYDDIFRELDQDDSIDDEELESVSRSSYGNAIGRHKIEANLAKRSGGLRAMDQRLKGNLEKTLPNEFHDDFSDDEEFEDDSFKFDSYEDVDSEYDLSDDEDSEGEGSSVIPADLLDNDDFLSGVEDDDLSDLDLLGEPEDEEFDDESENEGSSVEDDVLNELDSLSDDDFPEDPILSSDEKKKKEKEEKKNQSKKGLNEAKINVNHNQTSSANRRGRSKAEVKHEEEMTDLKNDVEKTTKKSKELNKAIILKLKEAIDVIGNLEKKVENFRKNFSMIQERFEASQNLNGKLLFINKALMDSSLNERQKERIVEAISKAKNKGEAQLIFESLMTAKDAARYNERRTIEEGLRGNNSTITLKQNLTPESTAENAISQRWQKLAGIKSKS